MATTQIGLLLIGTMLGALFLFGWATVYYVPKILNDDHADDEQADAGHPS